jgi:hypothetical protein
MAYKKNLTKRHTIAVLNATLTQVFSIVSASKNLL